jgi:Phosphotransferase enzyme family
VAAATSSAAALDLSVKDATVLNDSNRLVLRLMPCDVVARVAPMTWQDARLEVELARRLAEIESPVGAPDPRVEPRVYERDGFAVTLWSYYEPVPSRELSPAGYAHALVRLHAGLRQIDGTTRHFLDRVADTQQDVANRDVTPELPDADRELLASTLRSLTRSIVDRGAAELLLHGEPHPWNVLRTKNGPLFIDFENAVRGPVEYDLAWVPEEVSEHYPGADQELVGECRGLILAIIAVWRWHRDDQHPSRPQRAEWLSAFRQGPPWPALDAV